MILYHGTNMDIEYIDLSKCAPHKDFGKGFYTTTKYNQAKAMAVRKSLIFGGKPCVISFEAPEDILDTAGLNVKVFPQTSEEWAVFVINNRNRNFKNIASAECNNDNKYDIVFGPVANDTLTTLITQYQRGYIDGKILLKEMKYHAPSNQCSFHTLKAINYLKKTGVKWIM